MSNYLTKEKFLTDVESHVLSIIKDDGLYRHIRLSRPGSSCMRFDIITWPGSLCYTGDMGSYVFSRIADMFEFDFYEFEYRFLWCCYALVWGIQHYDALKAQEVKAA